MKQESQKNTGSDVRSVSVTLPVDLTKRIDAAARASDRSRSSFIRQAVVLALGGSDGTNTTSNHAEAV